MNSASETIRDVKTYFNKASQKKLSSTQIQMDINTILVMHYSLNPEVDDIDFSWSPPNEIDVEITDSDGILHRIHFIFEHLYDGKSLTKTAKNAYERAMKGI